MFGKTRHYSISDLSHIEPNGNRFVYANHDENDKNTIVLYRGIAPFVGPYAEQTHAQLSVIAPKQPFNITTPLSLHLEGVTQSAYTSWTPVYQRALERSRSGIIMKGVFKLKDVIHSREIYDHEYEYSVFGTVIGAKPFTSNNLTTPEEIKNKWLKEKRTLDALEKEDNAKINARNSFAKRYSNKNYNIEYNFKGKAIRIWKINSESSELIPNKKVLQRSQSEPNLKLNYNSEKYKMQFFKKIIANRCGKFQAFIYKNITLDILTPELYEGALLKTTSQCKDLLNTIDAKFVYKRAALELNITISNIANTIFDNGLNLNDAFRQLLDAIGKFKNVFEQYPEADNVETTLMIPKVISNLTRIQEKIEIEMRSNTNLNLRQCP